MIVAILALQGAFAEHQQMLHTLGVESTLIRNLNDWEAYLQMTDNGMKGALIIPGGESTAMLKIMRDEQLFGPIQQAIAAGLPVLGTCAGLIMLDREHLGTMDIVAKRNAYGRQLGSFVCHDDFKDLGTITMTFIRAPYIQEAGPEVEILATHDGKIVAARQQNQLVTAFHPELDSDPSIHQLLINSVNIQNTPT